MSDAPAPAETSDPFRQSELLFKALIENAHDVILMIDRNARVVYASPAVRKYGNDPDTIRGQNIWDSIHPDHREKIRTAFQDLLEHPRSLSWIDVLVRDAEGNWRHKEAVMHNLLDLPIVAAVVVNVHDITERKRAEDELRSHRDQLELMVQARTRELADSEARYRRLIENLKVDYIFFSQDTDATIRYISPSIENVLGYQPAAVVGRSFGEHATDDPINQAADRAFAEALAGKSPDHCEAEVFHADGSRRFLEYLNVPVFDAAGRVIAVEGIARDITERKRAEVALQQAQKDLEEANAGLERRVAERTEELDKLNLALWDENSSRRQAEEKFRNIIRDQSEFIVRWQPDGTRTFVNESYCRFFGADEGELLGTSFFSLVLDEEARTRVENLAQTLTPDQPRSEYEHRVPRPDGSIGWTHWCDRGVFDELGKLIEIQSVGRDITPEKDSAEKLQRMSDELAHVARLSLLGEMMAEINHEICQPLQSISNFATASLKALEANDADSRERVIERIRKIRDQVDRAKGIIKRRLSYARAAGTSRADFQVNQAIEEAIEMIESTARRRAIRVKTHLAPNLPALSGDRLQIEQVLVNLLRNACEAMDDTPPSERELVVTSARENGSIRVAVRDRGSGLASEIADSLFQAFVTTKEGGVGIGLVISQRIVEQHGGLLQAQANADRGMTFSFTLKPDPS